ncbi:hypothetical protein BBD39_06500 [Arsenophonus endosymbiont of Bemisia tabaci Asia II 3]|nr:hypothetical protein BBD39_06500 [Arsenophonus endosymbiont of Bemisia tabaci Asia II 3]
MLNIKRSPAKVIIANPNDITCDDCQFSNTTGVDLVAGKMNYINNTINYQTDKEKIIFTGLGIWGNGNSSINEKNKFLSNLTVYAGNVRLIMLPKLMSLSSIMLLVMLKLKSMVIIIIIEKFLD